MSRHPRRTEQAFSSALAAADWLTPADAAIVRVARDMAEQIDSLVTPAQQRMVRDAGAHASKTAYVIQTYQRLLTAMGLTPEGRRQLGIEPDESDDALAAVLRGHFGAGSVSG